MNKRRLLLLSVLSGLLLIPAWFETGHGLILMVAFIPLFVIEDYLDMNKHQNHSFRAFLLALPAFFVWNAATTWWIFNATAVGMAIAILANTILMSLLFWFFHVTKRNTGRNIGYFGFIVYWLAFEHFYFNAELAWPWLTLGHGFSYHTRFIQWYDSTGVLGGSLWILLCNVLLYASYRCYIMRSTKRQVAGILALFLFVLTIPVVISFIKYFTYHEKSDPREIVVLQPNIDPYQKFISDPYEQTLIQLELTANHADSSTDYVVGPETSINNSIWLHQIESVPDIRLIRAFLQYYPGLKYVVGAQCYERVYGKDTLSSTVKRISGSPVYYESYNAALQLDSTPEIQVYFKSELVVGVEKMPYQKYLKFLNKLIIRLGGTTRGWSTQEEREVFFSPQDSTGVAPVICWESVFGEYLNDYILKGADFIFVITNDGWWGDTPGYRQHNALSRIRAVETRRSIARSANTGISCFIDQRGDIIKKLGWWERGAINARINANDKLTFYVRNGDYIGRISRFFALITALYLLTGILLRMRRTGNLKETG
ncbi:MAG: apolipoprotein N-acyltransferase [Bacteroidales bacterium]|nr:apolipoprotein N-acyltransferase [Bacteroidales bacterium]